MAATDDKRRDHAVSRALYSTVWGGSSELPLEELTERERSYWTSRAKALVAYLDLLGWELRHIPPEG